MPNIRCLTFEHTTKAGNRIPVQIVPTDSVDIARNARVRIDEDYAVLDRHGILSGFLTTGQVYGIIRDLDFKREPYTLRERVR
jgi:hypothetical protein